MKQMIRDAFDTVTCSDALKKQTCDYVAGRMRRGRKSAARKLKWAVSMACLLLFATSGLGGLRLYYAEAAVISIDVNPSIELDINRWGRVVDQTTYGQEGETILQSLSLKHMEYGDALTLLLGSDEMQKYFKKDSLVSITLEAEDDGQAMLSDLQACVDTALKQCHGSVTAEYASVDSHMCDEAHEHGMSLGKYYAIQELLTVDPQATLDEFKDKSMKEIRAIPSTANTGSRPEFRSKPGAGKKLWMNPRATPRTIQSSLRNAPADRPTAVRAAATTGGITDAAI